jgi:hypothetical protein
VCSNKPSGAIKHSEYLTSRGLVGFSGRTLLCGVSYNCQFSQLFILQSPFLEESIMQVFFVCDFFICCSVTVYIHSLLLLNINLIIGKDKHHW